MAWIGTVAPQEARGLLARLYEAAIKRAGRIYNIIRIQSLRPRVLQSSTRLYLDVMHSQRSGLTRAQREMIATVVSQINKCHY
jgi:alkylhydroperoxidase family enzyme